MPLYDYQCPSCSNRFAVAKRIADIDNFETCPECQASCDGKCRLITKGKEFFGEKPDEPFYSVALGKWVKGTRDLRRQAKERGMIEVGSENIEKLNRQADRERERRDAERWSDYINPKYEVRA